MELCPTLDMIGDYFRNALQGYQFFFRDIIIGIHEDDIPSFNVSVISLPEERKIN